MRLRSKIVYFFCLIFLSTTSLVGSTDMLSVFLQQIQQSENDVTLFDLPGLQDVPAPTQISGFLSSLCISNPEIYSTDNGYKIDTNLHAYGIDLITEIDVQPSFSGDLDISVLINFPEGWKLSTLMPAFQKLDIFSCKNMKLIISNYDYYDQDLGVFISKGVNLFTSLFLDGILRYIIYFLGQEDLNQIDISGLIVPGIIGSSFSAHLPGQIDFIGGLSAQDIVFSISIDGNSSLLGLPSCSLHGSMQVDCGDQDSLLFNSAIDLYFEKASLSGSMQGIIHNIFGIYGLHAGNWSIGGTIDYAALGLWHIPLSEFFMGFELGIGSKKVVMSAKIGLGTPGIGDLAFQGTLDGDLSLDDCVELASNVIEETPTIETSGDEFRELATQSIPSFDLEDVYLFFSPNDVQLNGINYKRGLIVEGKAYLFGSEAQVSVNIQDTGMKIIGYLEEMEFGPVKITGPGYDRIMDTPDDGLILDAEITVDKQCCFVGAVVEIDVLGGISANTTIDVSASDIKFLMEKRIFNLFDCSLDFSATLNQHCIPVDFYVYGQMHQSALTTLQEMLSKVARSMAKDKMLEFEQKKFSISEFISGAYDGFWNILANIIGNTFNITEFSFESSLDDLVGKSQLPSVTIKGTVLGKDFEINDITFDLDDIVGSVTSVVELLSGLFD